MDETSPLTPTAGTIVLAAASYLAAMLMAGLLTGFHRLSGRHRHGLLEEEKLPPVLRGYLEASRRFQVTVSSIYLAATVLGVMACGQLLAAIWPGDLNWRFHLTFVVLLLLAWSLGSLLLKIVAAGSAQTYVRVVGSLVWPLTALLRPWAALLLAIMDRLDDTLWAAEAQPLLSTGEIRSLIKDEEGEVDLDAEEREMIQSIFTFHDTAVREIMVPRIDMVAFEQNTPVGEVIATVNECKHSRLPLYDTSVDRVVGVLYAKDLLNLIRDDRLQDAGSPVKELMRPAYFIPESKKIDEVLDEFRDQRIHMAVVIDEYGGTAGIVTLEDVIEEIVGEIEDEFDVEETLYEWLGPTALRVDPKIDLEDLEQVMGRPVAAAAAEESSETLGGLIYEAAGNVPAAGDAVAVYDLTVTVEKVEDQRIVQAVIHAPEQLPGWPDPQARDRIEPTASPTEED